MPARRKSLNVEAKMHSRNRQSYLNALNRANQRTPRHWHFATTQGMLALLWASS